MSARVSPCPAAVCTGVAPDRFGASTLAPPRSRRSTRRMSTERLFRVVACQDRHRRGGGGWGSTLRAGQQRRLGQQREGGAGEGGWGSRGRGMQGDQEEKVNAGGLESIARTPPANSILPCCIRAYSQSLKRASSAPARSTSFFPLPPCRARERLPGDVALVPLTDHVQAPDAALLLFILCVRFSLPRTC